MSSAYHPAMKIAFLLSWIANVAGDRLLDIVAGPQTLSAFGEPDITREYGSMLTGSIWLRRSQGRRICGPSGPTERMHLCSALRCPSVARALGVFHATPRWHRSAFVPPRFATGCWLILGRPPSDRR